MVSFIDRILRAGEGRVIKQLQAIAAQVDALDGMYNDFSDTEIKEQTAKFKARLADGETIDDLLPEAFALVREASVRTLGQKHYTVQLVGGAAIHQGKIAEMKTGEGKTLVATLPSYLNALTGKGVHVVTVNDYLAEYQSELMGRVYRALGMTTGCVLTTQNPADRRKQYLADITYGTNNEFGFDYLRDNMAWQMEDLVQREHHFAIVDEVDSILIDEARTPLIISGPAGNESEKWYTEFAKLVLRMSRDIDYEVDEKKRTVGILEPGIEKVEDRLGIDNLYESLNTPLVGFINNAIKAKELFKRDKDYIVRDGEVMIVDEHTGRVLPGRRYSEGMHQAIEAKEGVEIKAENQTLATITLQNYFRLYDKIAGMTGTAETEAEEFMSTYGIGVVPIPTNRPMIREDKTDLVYVTRKGKYQAIVKDVKARFEKGQPVLLGTASVERSEEISEFLSAAKIPHEVLNAKQHKREAEVVAMAGRKGAVTVATNMAGRGTDIMLGGNAEFIAQADLREQGLDPDENPEEYEAAWPQALQRAKDRVKAEHDEVVALGGLYVLGSERHESRRIDNQLRGRSGRQGDPGESRFYLSFDDDLLRLFSNGLTDRMIGVAGLPEDEAVENKFFAKGIERAQTNIESHYFEMRKNVLKYDDVMSEQRRVVYAERRLILEGHSVADQVQGFIDSLVENVVLSRTMHPDRAHWEIDGIVKDLEAFAKLDITAQDIAEQYGHAMTQADIIREFSSAMHVAYDEREELFGEEMMRELERLVLLRVLDQKWQENLYEMDYLKEGIGLRAMAQRDPLVEYKREAYDMFLGMQERIKEDTLRYVYNYDPRGEEPESETEQQVGAESFEDGEGDEGQVVQVPANHSQTGKGISAGTVHKRMPLRGAEPPKPQQNLTFTSAAKDGSGEARTSADGSAQSASLPPAMQGNRAERRAQERAARKAAKKRR